MSCNGNCCQGRECDCAGDRLVSLVARLLLVILTLMIFFGIYSTT